MKRYVCPCPWANCIECVHDVNNCQVSMDACVGYEGECPDSCRDCQSVQAGRHNEAQYEDDE